MNSILDGIRVIEWAHWHVGPYCADVLARMGAEVIKIEDRVHGDALRGHKTTSGISLMHPAGHDVQFHFEMVNVNKKSITVDVKKPGGNEVVRRLVEKSDVFVTNFQNPEAVGLDYESLKGSNPRLVYASANGFGKRGPDAKTPSYDLLGLARSGAMFATGEAGTPPMPPPGNMSDRATGVYLAFGVVSALFAREKSGVGQEVFVSQLGAMINLVEVGMMLYHMHGMQLPRSSRAGAMNPLWNWYRCGDGRWIAIAFIQSDRYWPHVCTLLGVPELEKDSRFSGMAARQKNRAELVSLLDGVFASKTYAQWEELFRRDGDVIFAPVNTSLEVFSDPQVVANQYVIDMDHPALGRIKFPGFPIEFSENPAVKPVAAPQYGQNTEEVLLEVCGYDWPKIVELKEQQVI